MFALLAFAGGARAAEPQFPELTGRIVDNANLLKPEDRAAIEADLKALEEKSTDQLVVVTLPSLQGYEIEDFGYQLGRKWAIGQKGKNNGVLLIVAPNERKVRIETGRGLEPLVTDLMSKIIIENAIVPEFRRGDYSAGIRAGVRDIKDVLLGDEEAVKDRARGTGAEGGLDWMSVFLICFWLGDPRPSSSGRSSARARRPTRAGRPTKVSGPSADGDGAEAGPSSSIPASAPAAGAADGRREETAAAASLAVAVTSAAAAHREAGRRQDAWRKGQAMSLISDAGKKRIADAITAAERQTSGEIVAVITKESSSYLYAPFMWAAVIALLVPWPLIHFTWWPSTWVYGAQLATFFVSARDDVAAAGALLAGAEIDQTGEGAPAGAGAVPGAEHAHDGRPDRRSHIRVGRGASCGDPGRCRHRAARAQGDVASDRGSTDA